MSTHLVRQAKLVVTVVFLMTGLFMVLFPASTNATALPTESFQLEKKISDNISPNPYSPADFSFQVTGNGYDELVTLGAPGGGLSTGSVTLPPGTYTVTEIGPDSFVPEDWTVQWSGYGCENKNSSDLFTSLTVTESDDSANICRADNQWRPQETPIVGCMNPDANNYDPAVDEDNGSCTFDTPVSGCTDVTANNYDAYATTDDASCTFDTPVSGCTDATANNYDVYATIDDGSCAYDQPTYLVFGYVWHDENSNTDWDGFGNEEATTTEPDLDDWTVEITNGSTTHSTATDEDGYYEFWVPAGTWTIVEVLQSDWSKTFPVVNGHVVEVIDETITQAESTSILAIILDVLIPTAHAQVNTTYGPFNFGNVFVGGGNNTPTFTCTLDANNTNVRANAQVILTWDVQGASTTTVIDNGIGAVSDTGSTTVIVASDTVYTLTATKGTDTVSCPVSITTESSSGGRGPSSGGDPSSGGSSTSGSSSGSSDPADPVPQILGEQVSAVPAGAPNAGAGGTSPRSTSPLATVVVLLLTVAVLHTLGRKNKNA